MKKELMLVRLVIAVVFLVAGLLISAAFVHAQEPTVEPTVEPSPFPTEPPVLPGLDELPENPLDLMADLDNWVYYGFGVLLYYIIEGLKAVPGIGKDKKVKDQITGVIVALATAAVTVLNFYFTQAAMFLYDSGIWSAFLAVLAVVFTVHRGIRLAQHVDARLVKQLHTKHVSP